MSLWEKWEKEKLERMGIKVERKSDIHIQEIRPKADIRKQSWIVGGVILACLLTVFLALILNQAYGGRWSDYYLIRVFAESGTRRMERFNDHQ